MVKIDLSGIVPFVREGAPESLAPELEAARRALLDGTCKGGEFTGWIRLPETYSKDEFSRIKEAAADISGRGEPLVVIGIGGSYLGAKAALDFLCPSLPGNAGGGAPDIVFSGNGLSSAALGALLERLGDRPFSINVISKSGTTTEPAVAFRVLKSLLEKNVGNDEAKKRIYCTTDRSRGALKSLADRNGYRTFVVPDDIGGRYSVLTAVGLLPMAAAGIDIDAVMGGARAEMERLLADGENAAFSYAAARNLLYRSGKIIEIFAYFEPSLRFFSEWYKQLFGESEGKGGMGIFPASVEFTADLHSMGQYIQEGERRLFETVLNIGSPSSRVEIPFDPADSDGLNFLAGNDLSFVAEMARKGTALAHIDGGVPNILLTADDMSPRSFGELVYFFEFSCALSGALLGVNPFDQPGVEAYKQNMFALLGKPGYEELRDSLTARLLR
ncbi:glucose-6-phosphate isomerase [Oscillospiraceae bacterium OttesenSCG-928-G22]|nr:glucose-6-phosphate isomerase [Oscillospiraceae bacterium OttesenSCG-928-G22]